MIITYKEAIKQALAEKMREDENVFLLGEDIGVYGGAFGVTMGLLDEFGPERVMDAPMSEAAFTGVGLGAALLGMKPVVEIMFADFLTFSAEEMVNQAAKIRFMTGGQFKVSLVIRAPQGSGTGAAAQHSQNVEAWFYNIPGIKIVAPSNPYDAKGLLKSAIEDDNLVLFLEHKLLYTIKGEVPEEDYRVPIGKSKVVLEGNDLTIVASSIEVQRSLEASKILIERGISPEIIDLRTLKPLDIEPIIESVKKTHRLMVVYEGPKTGGIGTEIISQVVESEAFFFLDAPIFRLGGLDTPIPYNKNLEKQVVPQVDDIVAAAEKIMKGGFNA
ncbi:MULTISPECIES: alpha-ketoacid dehydrogenase subunit beta [Bacteria]|jgi:pyruvate dehydrogenase E1 component beta subunit|uniref:alpha-ketoacid dehydrogenase subunit beta n=1 Tax=Bacteria TaxID=2 RepID=UPI003C7B5419